MLLAPKATEVKTNADMGKLTIAVAARQPRRTPRSPRTRLPAPTSCGSTATPRRFRRWSPARRTAVGGNMFYIDRLNEAKPGVFENKLEFTAHLQRRLHAARREGDQRLGQHLHRPDQGQRRTRQDPPEVDEAAAAVVVPGDAWKASRSWRADPASRHDKVQQWRHRPGQTVTTLRRRQRDPADDRDAGRGKMVRRFQALSDINLSVRAGEKIVLCGPSGSGKSTLVRCINHLETLPEGPHPDRGRLSRRQSEDHRHWCGARSAWCSSSSICFRI